VTAGLYNDTPVGAVGARVEKNEETGELTQLYIMTLGVLEPYRRCGVATQMLEYILDLMKDDAEFKDLLTVVIHVQTNNEAALAMYKQHGFEITGHKENYYQVHAAAAARRPPPAAAAASISLSRAIVCHRAICAF
jgi:ribosomal protein S18 acetylase RimI-like enzyme